LAYNFFAYSDCVCLGTQGSLPRHVQPDIRPHYNSAAAHVVRGCFCLLRGHPCAVRAPRDRWNLWGYVSANCFHYTATYVWH